MFEEKDDTILARWLAEELTDKERTEFEASPEYAEYVLLQEGLAAFQKPAYDKEALRSKVWKGIENQSRSKVIRLKPFYYAAGIAASLLLLLGLFFNKVTYSTSAGENTMVPLPDGTEVYLNAATTLKHNRFFWLDNKVMDLEGEATFKVTKGEGFKVNTASGSISVLGTEFNIKTRGTVFETFCYEGKVKYQNEAEQQESYLVAGDAIKLKDNILVEFKHTDQKPSWQEGFSRFSNTELLEVILELEAQYGIVFTYDATMLNGHFTGTFVHDDLQLALKSVFAPMGINYDLSDDQKTVTLNAR